MLLGWVLPVILVSAPHLVRADGTGGHGHHEPHHEPHHKPHHEVAPPAPAHGYSHKTRSKCYGEHDTGYMKSATADLDYQLHHTLAAIPHAITKARSAIESGNLSTNRDQLVTGLLCLVAAISGSLGILHGKDPMALSSADQISLLGMNAWGYGYWGPFLLTLEDAEPDCGVKDFNRVVAEYSFITSLDQVYGDNYSSNKYTNPDNEPELRRYYVGEFGRKLKLALHCITSQGESVAEARSLVALIDKYVKLADQRLDYTLSIHY